MSLGDKAAALALAEEGMKVNPAGKDAVTGPASIEFFARVAAQAGEANRAIAALQELLSISYAGPLGPVLHPLPPCFGSIRRSIRFGMIRVFKSSLAAAAAPISFFPSEERGSAAV